MRTGPNSDLWAELWRLVDSKNLDISITWVKAHGMEEPHFIDKYRIAKIDLFGNACADKLADNAAERYAHDKNTLKDVFDVYALLQKIQHRLLAILTAIIVAYWAWRV